MLGHLIRKEILDQILSLRFMILSLIGALTIWLSLFDGYAYYQARLRDHRIRSTLALNRLDGAFQPRYNARLDLALGLARLSPAFAFHNATIRLAGTGIDRHQRFETAFTRDGSVISRSPVRARRVVFIFENSKYPLGTRPSSCPLCF